MKSKFADEPDHSPHIASFAGVTRQATIRFSGLASDKLIGFGFAVMATKAYGAGAFGIYLFGIGVLEILFAISRLGLERATVRAVAQAQATHQVAEIRAIVRDALTLTIPASLLVTGVSVVFQRTLANAFGQAQLTEFFRFALFAVTLSPIADMLLMATEGLGQQRYYTFVRLLIEPLTKTVLAAALFFWLGEQAGVTALGLSYGVAAAGSLALAYGVYHHRVKRPFIGQSPTRHLKELLRVGLPFCGSTLLNRIFARAEIFLIFSFVSAAATAQYTLAQRTALLTTMIVSAFDAAFRPSFASALARGNQSELQNQFLLASRFILMLCLPPCIILICVPTLVLSVISKQLLSASEVVPLIAIGTLISALTGPTNTALLMAARTRILFVQALLAGALGLSLNLILIPALGVLGAGIAQLVAMSTLSALNAYSARKALGVIGFDRRHTKLLIAAAVALVATLSLRAIAPANPYLALAFITAAAVGAYVAALLLLGFETDDRQLFKQLFAKLAHRPSRFASSQPTPATAPEAAPLRILVVSQRMLPYRAGAEIKAFSLARFFNELGAQTHIVTTKFAPDLPANEVMEGVPVRRLPVLRTRQESGLRYLASKLSQLLAMAVYLAIHGRAYDVVYAKCASASALGAVCGARLRGVPVVLEPSLGGPDGEIQKLMASPARAVWSALLRSVDRLAINNPALADELRPLGLSPARIVQVQNGVDTKRFHPATGAERARLRQQFDLPDAPIALFVGQLIARKGIAELLAAWKEVTATLPEALLLFVGEGAEAEAVCQAAHQEAAQIRYLGLRDDVADCMRAADVFVLPSRNESFGNVIIEAMACGLPIITGRTGIALSLPLDPTAGRLVDVRNPAAIACALREILSLPDRGHALGQQARRLVEPYDFRRVAQDYLALYEALREHTTHDRNA